MIRLKFPRNNFNKQALLPETFSALLPRSPSGSWGSLNMRLMVIDRKKRHISIQNSCFPKRHVALYLDVPAKSDDARCPGCGL